MIRERRLKTLLISDELLIHALLQMDGSRYCQRYKVVGLPDGWQVERVGHDIYSCNFAVVISHPSFDALPEGYPIPRMTEEVRFERVEGGNRVAPATVTFREFL